MNVICNFILKRKGIIFFFLILSIKLSAQIIDKKKDKIEDLYFDAILSKNWRETDSLSKVLIKYIYSETDRANYDYYKGFEYFHKEEYKKAIDNYLKAREQFIELKDIERQGEIEGAIVESIAFLESNLIDYEEYLNSLCEIAVQTKNKVSVFDCEFYKGYFKELKGEYKEALKHYKKVSEITLEYKDTLAYYTNQINVGKVLVKLKRYNQSISIFNSVKEFYKEVKDLDRNFLIHLYLSEVYLEQKKYNLSLSELEQAKLINNQNPTLQNNYDLHNHYIEIYRIKKKYKEAFQHSRIADLYKDSLRYKKAEEKIFELKTKYEISENEKKLYKVQNENLNLKVKRKQSLIVILISVFLIFVISYIAYVFFLKHQKSKKEVQLLQQELNAFKEEKYRDKEKKENQLVSLKSKAILNSSDILYVKSDGHYVEYYLENKVKPEIDRNSLSKVIEILPSSFVRIHKSFIVNIYRIKIINSTKVMLDNGVWINLSRTYKQQLKDILHKED